VPQKLTLLLGLAVCTVAACGSCDGKNNPPVAPLPRHAPDGAFAGYPHDDGGRPILMSSTYDGYDLELVYDEALDDPLVHWGQCLDRVTSCFAANDGVLGNCVDLIEICDAGSFEGCCPQSCIDEYKRQRRSLEEWPAIEASFLEGSCIDGFKDQLSILDEPDVTP
jgi:hypothetical protein